MSRVSSRRFALRRWRLAEPTMVAGGGPRSPMTGFSHAELVSRSAAPDPRRAAGRTAGGLVLAIACMALAGCAAKQKPRAPRVPVTVATAVERPMPVELVSTGTVEPIQTAAL